MHTIALNSAAEQVMTLGQTVLVTEASCERRAHYMSIVRRFLTRLGC